MATVTDLRDVMSKLEEIVAMAKAANIPFEERYIDAGDIASLLHFKPRYVLEDLTKRQGFPRPMRVDGVGHPRWKAAEVMAWAEAQRAA